MSVLRRHLKAQHAALVADLTAAILDGRTDEACDIALDLHEVDHLLILDRTPDAHPHGYVSLWRRDPTHPALRYAAAWEQAGIEATDPHHRRDCFQRAKEAMAPRMVAEPK